MGLQIRLVKQDGSGQPSWLPVSEQEDRPFSTGHAALLSVPLSVVPAMNNACKLTHGAIAVTRLPVNVQVVEQSMRSDVKDAGNAGSDPERPRMYVRLTLVRFDRVE